ncbi:COG3650 family protein [Enterovibrio sp. 27052020O]|uniref:COG3650 family protein n=1 Tax=Enterovibrio sp. 27052020O TaxID=3241166 RepID=UPI003890B37A
MPILNRSLPKLLGLTVFISLLSACSQSPSGPVELGNSDDLQKQSPPQSAPTPVPQRFMLRGEVTLGHDVSAISPCGSNSQYWLQLAPSLSQQGLALSASPYSTIYGEVIGEFVAPSSDGFAADYPATFKVTQLNLMSAEIDGCQQPRDRTVASGTEPFWGVSVENNTLQFDRLGYDSERFTLTARNISPEARMYQTDGATLTLRPALCSDGMSDSIYGWTSTFTKGKQSWQGCATLSADDPTQEWVGNYQGVTTLGDTRLTTTVTLNPDHSATTHYQQANEPELIETGIWQQVNANAVQVMMTRHQGQYLVSERLFERNGLTLTADKEIVNGREYSLGAQGLTLSLMVGSEIDATNISHGAERLAAHGVEGSAEFNPKVDAALKAYLGDTATEAAGTRYRWLSEDLNNDGDNELLVLTDWCGSGGCTLLVFANQDGDWRFNSRITLVHLPFQMGNATHNGWRDLIMPVGGGGAKAATHVLHFDGNRYPSNPSVAPEVSLPDATDTYLFSDGIYPQQEGITLN